METDTSTDMDTVTDLDTAKDIDTVNGMATNMDMDTDMGQTWTRTKTWTRAWTRTLGKGIKCSPNKGLFRTKKSFVKLFPLRREGWTWQYLRITLQDLADLSVSRP
jgi:hypothetical protein